MGDAELRHNRVSLRGIHALPGGIAWASGSDGTVLRTEDGGYLWQQCAVPKGAEKLDFRGVWAWEREHRIVMSSGPGDLSRIYKTTDGCKTWALKYTNPDENGFWDAIVFVAGVAGKVGFVLGDPVAGAFRFFRTRDQGEIWGPEEYPGLDADGKKEGAFAASNTALAMKGGRMFFASGGTSGAYVSHNYAKCVRIANKAARCSMAWEKVAVPLAGGAAGAGVFSVAMRTESATDKSLIAVGGDYEKPNASTGTSAWSADYGVTWTAATTLPHGYRSAVAWDKANRAWIAAGPTAATTPATMARPGNRWMTATGTRCRFPM